MSGDLNHTKSPDALEKLNPPETAAKPNASKDLARGPETPYRALFELMPGSVVLLDAQGFVRDANPFFCRGIGYTHEELIGLHVTRFSKEPPEFIERNIRRMLAGEMLEHVITNVQKDGSTRFYELRESAVALPDGTTGILAVSNDITDRKRAEDAKLEMERRLLHAQKLESLGMMAGGIAHDFNNLLAAMMGNIELAMLDLAATSPAQQCLKEALAAGRRAAGLTRQMLAYSGRGNFVISEVGLSELVMELAEFLKSSTSKSAQLELRLASGLPTIHADASQLQQVVMNLVTNASEALGDQPGLIRITTRLCECNSTELAESRLAVKPPPGRFVELEVSDTGCGMDEAIQEKLFDPFFTTKFVGRGLGMSVVMGVLQGHNGAILLSSQPGKGSVLRVLFPVSPIAAVSQTPAALHESSITYRAATPTFSGTVLIADDETQVRTVFERFLARLGLRVLSAVDGEHAVSLFQQHAGEITFVLLDLTMPKLDGLKTLIEIRRVRPNIKVALTSGYEGGDVAQRYSKNGFDAFIQKPCDLDTLTKLVQQMGVAAL